MPKKFQNFKVMREGEETKSKQKVGNKFEGAKESKHGRTSAPIVLGNQPTNRPGHID